MSDLHSPAVRRHLPRSGTSIAAAGGDLIAGRAGAESVPG